MNQEVQVVMLPTKDKSRLIDNHSQLRYFKVKPIGITLNTIPQHLYITVPQEVEPILDGEWYAEAIMGSYMIHQMTAKSLIGWYKTKDRTDNFKRRCLKIIATTDKKLTTRECDWVEADVQGHMECLTCGDWIEDGHALKCKRETKLVAKIPQSFIKEYCDKGGIDKVMVEYERDYENRTCESCNLFDEVCELKLEKKCCTATKDIENHGDYWISRMDEEEDSEIYKLKLNSDNTINISLIEEKMYSREEVEELCRDAYLTGHDDGQNTVSGPIMEDSCSAEEWIKENL
jgi:hypothetical protein